MTVAIEILLGFHAAGGLPLYGGGLHDGGSVPGPWSPDPLIAAGLTAAAWLYVRGWRVMARRAGAPGQGLKRRARLFAAGMAMLALALVSPLDGMAESLFSAHMVQHTLLMLAAAPLLVAGAPLPVLLLGTPMGLRRAFGGVLRTAGRHHSVWRALWRAFTQPAVVWLLHAGLLWVWHAPGLYEASVEVDAVHALQHGAFLGSALLFWWVTLYTFGAVPEQRGAGILYLFTTALQSGLLGALLTFSPRVWYPVYLERAERWGLSALADQQLAGTIMWVPAGMVYLVAALWMMKHWLDGLETRSGAAGSLEERKLQESAAREPEE